MDDLPDAESVWCKITFCDKKYVIGAVYRPPDSPLSTIEIIYDFTIANFINEDNFILAGDFNLPKIDWSNLEVGNVDVKSSELILGMMFNLNLTQVVNEATRAEKTASSVLDLLFVSTNLSDSVVFARGHFRP